MKTRNFSTVLAFHALVYLVLLAFIGVSSHSVIFESSTVPVSNLFLLLGLIVLGHSLVIWRTQVPESVVFIFFLADAVVGMVLVRASGFSASPFLVLFSLLALAGAMIFRPTLTYILVAFCVLLQSLSIGFGPSIVGYAVATTVTGLLGLYLIKALATSGEALEVSEVARKRLETLQKAILANIPSGLLSIDSEGRIIQINGVGLRILSMTEAKVLYVHLKELMPSLEKKIYHISTLAPEMLALPVMDPADRPTIRYRRPNGEELQLGYSLVRLYDPDDKTVIGSLLVFQDLTKIVRMEENLRLSEKLAAVGKLAAAIAHEIRNPLASISGSAQLLAGTNDLGEEDRRLLNIIQRESLRLDALINEFLDYVRPPKPKLETVDVNKLVADVVESMRVNPTFKSSAAQISVRSEGNLQVWADENKVSQALMNLILNAGQAGAKEVEVLVSPDSHLAVIDNGSGISPENQKRLFEPFFTTKESGNGLGLATAYRFLESMGARITVESPLPNSIRSQFTGAASPHIGGGTMFSIYFKGVRDE